MRNNKYKTEVMSELVCILRFFHQRDYFNQQPVLLKDLAELPVEGIPMPSEFPAIPTMPASLNWSEESLFGEETVAPNNTPPHSLRQVLYGVKPLGLIHGDEYYLNGLLQWAYSKGLYAILAPYEFEFGRSKKINDYSNLIVNRRVPLPDYNPHRNRSLLVSPDYRYLVWGWMSLLFSWDELLGELLGYPKCCIKSFVQQWNTAAKDNQGELANVMVENSSRMKADWKINIFGRYWGYELLNHFPCKMNCKHSLALADQYASALQLYEPEYYAELKAFLSSYVVIKEPYEVVLIKDGNVKPSNGTLHLDFLSEDLMFSNSANIEKEVWQEMQKLDYNKRKKQITLGEKTFSGRLVEFVN